jgi:hypothetical protein
MFLIGSILDHSNKIMTQRYARDNWRAKLKAVSSVDFYIENAVGTHLAHIGVNLKKAADEKAVNADQ